MAEGIRGMAELKMAFADLEKMAVRNQSIALKLVGNEYKNDVQEIAPYKTGTYRRSIHVQPVDSSKVLVGSDLPYGKRLEYGFADSDKLGRVYNQAAQPHFRPAMDTNIGKYQKMYLEVLSRA